MRLFKIALAVWVDTNWLMFLRKSWKVESYWFTYRPHQFTLGPIRFDFKAEGELQTEV